MQIRYEQTEIYETKAIFEAIERLRFISLKHSNRRRRIPYIKTFSVAARQRVTK